MFSWREGGGGRASGVSALAALALAATGAPAMSGGPDPPPGARARDGNIAIRQELDAARAAGSVAAYDLFIARHPDHPLARTARCERDRLAADGRGERNGRDR